MTTNPNPYQTPSSTQGIVVERPASHQSRFGRRYLVPFSLLASLYPIWLVGSFYLTWLIAWCQLGHRPRPMLDDPKSIGGILYIVYYLPGILLMLMPVLAPMGLASTIFFPIKARRVLRYVWRTSFAVAYVVLFIIALQMLRSDPGRVIEWWFD